MITFVRRRIPSFVRLETTIAKTVRHPAMQVFSWKDLDDISTAATLQTIQKATSNCSTTANASTFWSLAKSNHPTQGVSGGIGLIDSGTWEFVLALGLTKVLLTLTRRLLVLIRMKCLGEKRRQERYVPTLKFTEHSKL